MPKARQQYLADEVSLNKEAMTFSLDDELLQKIEDMDIGEENVIEVVKVNSVPLPVDADKAVDVTVPLVQDSLDSVDPNKSLSARQWKILYDYIVALQSRGRFLSNWNANLGTPVTAPFGQWYTYNPWDYYIVTVVSNWWTNLRPEGTVYTGAQSSTPETEQLDLSDIYVFDWQQWLLQKNSGRVIAVDQSLSTTSPNPVENRVITNELNNKQNKLIAWANIQIDQNTNTISATGYSNLPAAQGWTDNTLVTTWDKYNWDNKQDGLQAWANIQINWNIISATNTTYGNLPEAQGGTSDTLVTTWDKYNWNHKQDNLTAWQNITISNGVISATDTTYTAWTWISIDANNVISNTQTSWEWWNITWDINNQTDLISLLNDKQDKLTAWQNIQINNNVISATDTTYTALDFDIKDLADSLDLRNTWSNKQDRLVPWTRITIQGNVISADISWVFVYKWNVNDVSDLPSSWQNVWDTYFVEWTGEMYAWDWTQWNRVWWPGIDLTNYFNKTTDTTDNIIQWSNNLFVTQIEKNTWNNKQNRLIPWDNITIANNTISAKSYTGWDYINVSSSGVINNEKPFIPTNTWNAWQVLKKTWANTYAWEDESWWWWGGGTSYSAWYWISISNNIITNTKPFNPGSWTTWQVLTKTASGYGWQNFTGEQEVRVWNYPWSQGFSQSELQEICVWCLNEHHSAIIKWRDQETIAPLNLYVFWNHYTSNGVSHYIFYWMWEQPKTHHDANNWDWTTVYNGSIDITYDWTTFVLDTSDQTYQVAWNYLSITPFDYQNPFIPTQQYQPATKEYVDRVAAGSIQVPAITNNTTWTNLTLQQEWVGTQAQYNQITPINWVIYNIIPSS